MMKSTNISMSKTREQCQKKKKPLEALGLKSINLLSPKSNPRPQLKTHYKTLNTDSLWEFSPVHKSNVKNELSSTYYSTHSNVISQIETLKKPMSPSFSSTPNTKYNSDYFYQTDIPIGKLIEEIKQTVIIPMRTQMSYNEKRTRNITRAVKHLKTHISSVSEDFSRSMTNNQTFMKEKTVLSCEIEEIQIENSNTDKEINEIKTENKELLNERFRLDKETTIMNNEYLTMKNEIDIMKQKSGLLSKISEEIQYEKKLLASALMIVNKKQMQLKKMINLFKKNHNNIAEDLLLMIN